MIRIQIPMTQFNVTLLVMENSLVHFPFRILLSYFPHYYHQRIRDRGAISQSHLISINITNSEILKIVGKANIG